MKPAIILRANLKSAHGYGGAAATLAQGFINRGYEVYTIPFNKATQLSADIPDIIKQTIIHEYQKPDGIEIFYGPIATKPQLYPGLKKRIFCTMWETDRINIEWTGILNDNALVVVPSVWNQQSFVAGGVTVPVEIAPLAVDLEIFTDVGIQPKTLTIGCGGKADDCRKRLIDTIKCFVAAFPNEEDAVLKVHGTPDSFDTLPRFSDPRIQISRSEITDSQLAAWYGGLSCFLSMSYAEGWGLMQHQALACGKPLLAPNYGGLSEYFDQASCFALPYLEVPATGPYAASDGRWAQVDAVATGEQLRSIYADRSALTAKAAIARQTASKFAIAVMMDRWETLVATVA